jgi:D-beta-D-heptose 7-phosphate kinase / D-beta-D-heptose 1-phosphate adenosyltransferase
MFNDIKKIQQLIDRSCRIGKVLVVGDLMLDRYLWGRVERISPEAPVPVVRIEKKSVRGGGAANVALNLVELGADVALAGWVGDDAEAGELIGLLEDKGVDCTSICRHEESTTIKTRVFGDHQQVVRLDEEAPCRMDDGQQRILADKLLKAIDSQTKAIVLSDYAKGVLDGTLCRRIIELGKANAIPVIADPKGLDFSRYEGAAYITPNLKEFCAAAAVEPVSEQELIAAANGLRENIGVDNILLTRGEDGITLVGDRVISESAVAREVYDVSGAGDTVAACLAAGLLAGIEPIDIIRLANLAAGIVIGKVGTTPVTQADLQAALAAVNAMEMGEKVYSLDNLRARVEQWRAQGEKVAFSNGCFDLLHAGHVILLDRAHEQADRLIVALNSDGSVRRLKGPDRPIIPEGQRARVIASLSCVDAVIVFEQDTPLELLSDLRPDVLVKGDNYSEREVVGAEMVRSYGGKVVRVPVPADISTDDILSRIGSQ